LKRNESILVAIAVAAIAVIPADILYTSRFVPRFKELEKNRIITSNQLATAKIVSENLNHVRDLVFHNMDFSDHMDSVSHETVVFDFLTSCVNDLKMRVISVRPLPPSSKGSVTTFGYDIQLEGDFFSFGELCSKFENSRRVLALTSFEVTQAAHGGDPAEGKSGKASATPSNSGRRGVSIKLHLDTFRVRKG
jgi:hypothetical protein